jgi:hypothetical protein
MTITGFKRVMWFVSCLAAFSFPDYSGSKGWGDPRATFGQRQNAAAARD